VSFGDDRNLQLGLRKTNIQNLREGEPAVYSPQRVTLLGDGRVAAVAAGGGGTEGGHTAFLMENGELHMCGHGRWGQLGGKLFTHISPPKRVSTLAALREWNEAAQSAQPIRIVDISCGRRHVAAVLECGSVFVWGWNQYGQLGNGTSAASPTPTMVKSPPELRYNNGIRRVHCGPESTTVWS